MKCMKATEKMMGPCCNFSAGKMNFIDPAKRKRREAAIWTVQSTRLAVLAVEVDIVRSP
jgi:hypothetical protein